MAASMGRLGFSNFYRMCLNYTFYSKAINIGHWYRCSSPSFHTSAFLNCTERYRKVIETTDGDVTTIEAEYAIPEAGTQPLREEYKDACPICRLNLRVTYKDVLILKQFVKEDGSMLPKRVTGVCNKQHNILVECIKRANKSGLLPDHKPKEKMILPPGVRGKRKIRLPRF
ncbi:large ribosomal subunit protein mL66-like [Antedon mediterranea]|uniref:large ribosomal subunit protein mL66-like n=1 Tax=Antedon mediterranea TaxID=105859 RepID=UPI003AF842D2